MNENEEEKRELNENQPENGVELDLGGLSPQQQQRIRQIAAHEGTSVQSVLRLIIRRGLRARKKNPEQR